MKKIIIVTLCAFGLFASSAVVLNNNSTPLVAGGGGFGFVVR